MSRNEGIISKVVIWFKSGVNEMYCTVLYVLGNQKIILMVPVLIAYRSKVNGSQATSRHINGYCLKTREEPSLGGPTMSYSGP